MLHPLLATLIWGLGLDTVLFYLAYEHTANICLAGEANLFRNSQKTWNICSQLWNLVQQTHRLHVFESICTFQTNLGVCYANYIVKGCYDLAIKLIRTKAPSVQVFIIVLPTNWGESCEGRNYKSSDCYGLFCAFNLFLHLLCTSIPAASFHRGGHQCSSQSARAAYRRCQPELSEVQISSLKRNTQACFSERWSCSAASRADRLFSLRKEVGFYEHAAALFLKIGAGMTRKTLTDPPKAPCSFIPDLQICICFTTNPT